MTINLSVSCISCHLKHLDAGRNHKLLSGIARRNAVKIFKCDTVLHLVQGLIQLFNATDTLSESKVIILKRYTHG